ncbi:hypothetical protein ACFTSF_01900 [Kribbella sp. NPDC056951]|uniref:hypothetical protein n=1 Tax=Kribbella sp. NPDC056951 TaxID=3345978 RepID=UPI003631B81C
MIIERADADDLGVILALRTEASDWLAQRGINQWAVAWPNPEEQNHRILTSIAAGETWMIRDQNEATMGTVALDTSSDPQLWTPEEQAAPAMYMHRLIIRRKHAGLGAAVMDWACHRAQRLGLHWLRIDRPELLLPGRCGESTPARSGSMTKQRNVRDRQLTSSQPGSHHISRLQYA